MDIAQQKQFNLSIYYYLNVIVWLPCNEFNTLQVLSLKRGTDSHHMQYPLLPALICLCRSLYILLSNADNI